MERQARSPVPVRLKGQAKAKMFSSTNNNFCDILYNMPKTLRTVVICIIAEILNFIVTAIFYHGLKIPLFFDIHWPFYNLCGRRFLLLPLYFTADFFRLFAFQSATILLILFYGFATKESLILLSLLILSAEF